MDQELNSLLDKLSKEIFHEENFNAVPSMERIKTAMAAVNKLARKKEIIKRIANHPGNSTDDPLVTTGRLALRRRTNTQTPRHIALTGIAQEP